MFGWMSKLLTGWGEFYKNTEEEDDNVFIEPSTYEEIKDGFYQLYYVDTEDDE